MVGRAFELRQLSILQILGKYSTRVNLLDLHKIIYVLQSKGLVKLKYDFINYSFGPYSKELEEDLNNLLHLGLIAIEVNGKDRVVGLTEKGRRVLANLKTLSNNSDKP